MAESIGIALSADFLTAFSALPRTQQKRVRGLISKFTRNPTAPGLNYERIHAARDPQMRSLRIDGSYRAIMRKPHKGIQFVLLWADTHDRAYKWALRHECRVNIETGALQVYEPEPVTAPAASGRDDSPHRPGLFDALRDRQLLRLGVPEALLDPIRRIGSEDDLDQLQARLPAEAYEALFFFLEGESWEQLVRDRPAPASRVDPGDVDTALGRADSRARFAVAHDEMELEAMLSAPLERWRVFLHPSQRRLAERNWNGPVRVLGGAGTGKTVVAMHRARWLARQMREMPARKRILVTTFTRNLALDIKQNLEAICTPAEMRRIEVTNLDQWVHGFLRNQRYSNEIQFVPHLDAWREALRCKHPDVGLPDAFYVEEWDRIVAARGVATRRQYLRIPRVGRGTRLNRAARARVWPVFREYREQLAERGRKAVEDAYRDATALLRRTPSLTPYTSAIVDEAQDFGAPALRLLRRLAPEGPNDLFLVGDAHQRIYARGPVVLSRCGIRVVGRARKLRLSYRTTEQTRRWASSLLRGCRIDDLDGGADDDRVRSLTRGPAPKLRSFASFEEQARGIVGYLSEIREDEWRGVCVVARTTTEMKNVQRAVVDAGIEVLRLSKKASDDPHRTGVRFATMHRVKGLEFDRVLIASANRGLIPLEAVLRRLTGAVERDEAMTAERALVHVAATRAKRELLIFSYGVRSPFLSRG